MAKREARSLNEVDRKLSIIPGSPYPASYAYNFRGDGEARQLTHHWVSHLWNFRDGKDEPEAATRAC